MHRIVQANIDRFTLLLESETDPTKRAMLIQLLAEEKMKQATAARGKTLASDLAILAPYTPMCRLDIDPLLC